MDMKERTSTIWSSESSLRRKNSYFSMRDCCSNVLLSRVRQLSMTRWFALLIAITHCFCAWLNIVTDLIANWDWSTTKLYTRPLSRRLVTLVGVCQNFAACSIARVMIENEIDRFWQNIRQQTQSFHHIKLSAKHLSIYIAIRRTVFAIVGHTFADHQLVTKS